MITERHLQKLKLLALPFINGRSQMNEFFVAQSRSFHMNELVKKEVADAGLWKFLRTSTQS